MSKDNRPGLSFLSGDEIIMERRGVNTLLEKALVNSVVLVIAGEGYGKTCAVQSFLSKRNDPTVWIPLSERDNDPSHFWESVLNAEGFYNPRTRKVLEKIGFPETPGQVNRCHQVLRETAPDSKNHIIVVDDCHLIREEVILNFAKQIMAFPPLKNTFILISRLEPEFNTMSLLSKGLLSRIGADDLRFNEQEIGDYFRLKNIRLSREDPQKIRADTEGWVQAINLIAEEMKNKNTGYSRSLWENGSFRIMEESLFSSIPVPLQRFLVIISLFDQWPLEAVEKIAVSLPDNFSPAGELARNLDQLGSLIFYDPYIHGFRIHRAFLDYLREKRKDLSPEEIKAACSIVAQWYKENKFYINAAIVYGMAGDYEELLKAVYSFPRLMPRAAAVSLLDIVEGLLRKGGRKEKDENFLFLRHVTRAGLLANLGRYDEAEIALNESIRELEALPPGRFSSWILSACYNSLGSLSLIAYRLTKDISMASVFFQRGNYHYMRYPYAVSGPAAKTSIGSYVNPVGYPAGEGEFETFIDTVSQCIPFASNSIDGHLSGMNNLCRAELAFFRGNLNAAEQYGRKAVFDAREKGQYEVESKGLFYLHRIHLCNGNVSACRETREQMEIQLDIPDYINRYAIHDIMTGWFNAHIGKTENLASWLRNEFEESSLNLFFDNFETMVKAKSLFAEKKYEDVLKFLGQKKVREEGLGSFHLGMLEITVLEAATRSRMGDGAGAIRAFEAAYRMSRNDSLDMPFIELGEDMRALAGLVLNSKNSAVERQWLDMIRNRASIYVKKLTGIVELYPDARDVDEIPFLTSQELSILTGISRGLTRGKIAEDCSLSINTVKTSIKNICGKLGAFNRADAIRIASGLGLLKYKEL